MFPTVNLTGARRRQLHDKLAAYADPWSVAYRFARQKLAAVPDNAEAMLIQALQMDDPRLSPQQAQAQAQAWIAQRQRSGVTPEQLHTQIRQLAVRQHARLQGIDPQAHSDEELAQAFADPVQHGRFVGEDRYAFQPGRTLTQGVLSGGTDASARALHAGAATLPGWRGRVLRVLGTGLQGVYEGNQVASVFGAGARIGPDAYWGEPTYQAQDAGQLSADARFTRDARAHNLAVQANQVYEQIQQLQASGQPIPPELSSQYNQLLTDHEQAMQDTGNAPAPAQQGSAAGNWAANTSAKALEALELGGAAASRGASLPAEYARLRQQLQQNAPQPVRQQLLRQWEQLGSQATGKSVGAIARRAAPMAALYSAMGVGGTLYGASQINQQRKQVAQALAAAERSGDTQRAAELRQVEASLGQLYRDMAYNQAPAEALGGVISSVGSAVPVSQAANTAAQAASRAAPGFRALRAAGTYVRGLGPAAVAAGLGLSAGQNAAKAYQYWTGNQTYTDELTARQNQMFGSRAAHGDNAFNSGIGLGVTGLADSALNVFGLSDGTQAERAATMFGDWMSGGHGLQQARLDHEEYQQYQAARDHTYRALAELSQSRQLGLTPQQIQTVADQAAGHQAALLRARREGGHALSNRETQQQRLAASLVEHAQAIGSDDLLNLVPLLDTLGPQGWATLTGGVDHNGQLRVTPFMSHMARGGLVSLPWSLDDQHATPATTAAMGAGAQRGPQPTAQQAPVESQEARQARRRTEQHATLRQQLAANQQQQQERRQSGAYATADRLWNEGMSRGGLPAQATVPTTSSSPSLSTPADTNRRQARAEQQAASRADMDKSWAGIRERNPRGPGTSILPRPTTTLG